MDLKLCRQCNTEKLLSEFTRAKQSNNYKAVKTTYHSYCKVCNAERAREWRKQHKNYRGTGRINSIPVKDRLLMSAIRQRISDARTRSKKYGNTINISETYLYELFLKQERRCALTGVELTVEVEHPLCLSLDQIDPGKGYNEGNVQWLAWAVNRAKGDLSSYDFYEMCEAVLNWKVQRLSP